MREHSGTFYFIPNPAVVKDVGGWTRLVSEPATSNYKDSAACGRLQGLAAEKGFRKCGNDCGITQR